MIATPRLRVAYRGQGGIGVLPSKTGAEKAHLAREADIGVDTDRLATYNGRIGTVTLPR